MHRFLCLAVAGMLLPLAGCADESAAPPETPKTEEGDGLGEATPGGVPDWYLGDATTWPAQKPLIGQPIPTLELSDWIGPEQTREEMSGKVVVIDFWATWCGPCLAAIPHNNELYNKYKDKGVVLFGVCGSDSGQDLMAETAKENGIEYPIAKDATLKSAEAWNVMFWPTYAVVDQSGTVVAVGVNHNYLDEIIEDTLAKK